VMLAAAPVVGLVCLLTWLGAALVWRYSSLSALVAFAVYPVITFAAGESDRPRMFLALFLFGLIYLRHRENIMRLLAGTESKIGQKR